MVPGPTRYAVSQVDDIKSSFELFMRNSCSSLLMETQEEDELCFPQFLNSSCKKPTLLWSQTVILKIASFISVLTVFLNLLIIISISHFRQLHTPTNSLVLSLAVSDFLVGLLLMPVEIFRKEACWLLGDIVCVLYNYLTFHIVSASLGNIILITVDRYVAICYPLHYPIRFSVAKVNCSVCLCWLWYAFYSIFFLKDELIQPGRGKSCIGECVVIINFVIVTIDLVMNFIIPVIFIIFMYIRVFMAVVSQARAMHSHVTTVKPQVSVNLRKKRQRTKTSELKAARTLGVVVFVYLMCYCPFYCFSLIGDNLKNTSSTSFLFFFFLLIYFNSCLNPLIYALLYPWFKKAAKIILTLQILRPGSCDASIL
ncbi:trace amine-associated receptor 13c-like [Kryptolebias marmoratus]|uniref:trace amine-associated receptor 13c-like n=1 Tax=Kryptolebias marmoratus TaxID=37003 RepID=UPI0018ACCE01|nr:trace amine-associated receptor 13c-like [Kryptolebias marmoratus]